jgi:hypothetical protein
MSSIILRADTPCSYPTAVGASIKTAVGNTATPIAIFKNMSSIDNLRALMQNLEILTYNPSSDTVTCVQLVGGVEAVGGSFSAITGSELQVNTTATGFTGGKVALTLHNYSSSSHGNSPSTASVTDVEAERLGLSLFVNQTFAIVAFTIASSATVDLAWSVNWIEKD